MAEQGPSREHDKHNPGQVSLNGPDGHPTMAEYPGPPSGLIVDLSLIAELSFRVWFNRPSCPPGMQIFPKLTADRSDGALIRKQSDQRINRHGCIERQEGVHARFMGEADVEWRKSEK